MVLKYGAREARNRFADLIGRVGYGGEVIIVERSGKPMAVMMPVEMYESLLAEREARFGVVERMRESAPVLPEQEIEADVSEAIRAVRATDAAGSA